LTDNPELKAADADFRAYVHELLKERGGFEPTVTLFGDVGAEYVDDPSGLAAADNAETKATGELGVVAELPILDGFRRANQVYAAAARVDRSSFELLDASETMSLMVAEQYINVARQQRLLGIAEQNLRRLRAIRSQAQDLVDGGRLPVSDVLQVEASIFSAQATIADIQRALVVSAARYENLVGHEPRGVLQLPPPVAPPASLQDFVRAAVQGSYRVRTATSNVDVRGFEQEIDDAEFRPQLNLNAGASYGRNLDGARGEENRAFVGLGLTWKLYGGDRKDRRLALGERRNEALYLRMAVIRDVEELATIAWKTFGINAQRSQFLARQIDANTDLVASYNQEFELATRSVLDLLAAENGLFNARFEKVNNDAMLAFAGYRALAAQSGLARHFGVRASEQVLGSVLAPRTGQNPRAVIDKGQVLIRR
jgi:adhesin transport system outer membrane protein